MIIKELDRSFIKRNKSGVTECTVSSPNRYSIYIMIPHSIKCIYFSVSSSLT